MANERSETATNTGSQDEAVQAAGVKAGFAGTIAGLTRTLPPPTLRPKSFAPPSLTARQSDLPEKALAALDKFKNFAMSIDQFDKMYAEGRIGMPSPESKLGSIAKRTGAYARPDPKPAIVVESNTVELEQDDAIECVSSDETQDEELDISPAIIAAPRNRYDGFTPYAN